MSTYQKFPASSHASFDGITDGQIAVAAAALERVAERLEAQQQMGAATLVRRLGCAVCEQILAKVEDEHRG